MEEEDIESQMPPPEVIEDWYLGKPTPWPPEPEPQEPGPVPTGALRFAVGDRVRCRIGPGEDGWAAGTVVAHMVSRKHVADGTVRTVSSAARS